MTDKIINFLFSKSFSPFPYLFPTCPFFAEVYAISPTSKHLLCTETK